MRKPMVDEWGLALLLIHLMAEFAGRLLRFHYSCARVDIVFSAGV